MKLYLVQHGEARSEEEDSSRPLTEKGLKEVRKMADYVSKHLKIRVDRVFHSGKLRSKQTAEELAKRVAASKDVEKADGLDPLADPRVWRERLKGFDKDIMVVGHLPHLSRLSSILISGDESGGLIRFRKGGIVCLERDEHGNWSVLWVASPEMISNS